MQDPDNPDRTLSSLHDCPYGYPHFVSSVIGLITTLRPRKSFPITARDIYYGSKGMRVPEYNDADMTTNLDPKILLNSQVWKVLTIALTTMRRWVHGQEWEEHVVMLIDSYRHVFGDLGENPVLQALFDLDTDTYRRVIKHLERPRNSTQSRDLIVDRLSCYEAEHPECRNGGTSAELRGR